MGRGAGRIRTVNGLRGLAALLVVFDHTVGDSWGLGAWSAQNHGITVFALLTGFLLAPQFLRARLDGAELPAAGRFLRARAARILPAYWVALAAATLTIGLNSMQQPEDVWMVITLTQTLGTDTPFEGIPPAWSLSLFFSFYLALPVWSWWRRRCDRRRTSAGELLRRELLWLLALIGFAWVVRTLSLTDPVAEDPVFTLLGRADWFAIGMILAVVVIAAARGAAPRIAFVPGRRPGLAFGVALGLTIASALIPIHLEELRDQFDTWAAALLVAGAVLHGQTLRGPQRVLASAPAEALGRWSFGIFLWGYIVQRGIEALVPGIGTAPHLLLTLAGAVLLGAASWRWVEQPASVWLRSRPSRGGRVRRRAPEPVRAPA